MENKLREMKRKLKQLTGMLGDLNSSNKQVQQLKKTVYILNKILEDESNVVDPYGPHTAIVRYSLN